MKTPPWKLIVPTVCFDSCKYKKSETDTTLYRLYYSELLESFTDYTRNYTDGSKDGYKQLRLLSVNRLSSQNLYLTRRQFFTAELEAIVSALRYIKHCMLSSDYYEIFRFLTYYT